ncbi:hypothetical protein AKJ16_DCAP02514 [Drosera capensis]
MLMPSPPKSTSLFPAAHVLKLQRKGSTAPPTIIFLQQTASRVMDPTDATSLGGPIDLPERGLSDTNQRMEHYRNNNINDKDRILGKRMLYTSYVRGLPWRGIQ